MNPGRPPTLAATIIVPAAHLEPGDLLIGPEHDTPQRLWWRTADPAGVGLLLPHARTARGVATIQVTDPDQWHLIVHRDADPPAARLAVAARGALWLHLNRHPDAPTRPIIQMLVADYATHARITLARAWADTASAARHRHPTPG